MSFLTVVREEASSFAKGKPQGLREYPLGMAGIGSEDFFWGADPNVAAPEEFGDYLLTSNPVYSVTTQRANYLASLPLRLFRFTGDSALSQVPRMPQGADEEILRRIYDTLGQLDKTRGPAPNLLARNVIASLGALQNRDEINAFLRQMGMEEIVEGPVFELLHRVNDFWSGTRLVRMTSLARDLWGQSYWVINRGEQGRGEPEEIWWVKPTRMRVIPHPVRYISHYEFDPIEGEEPIIFFPWEVVRIYNANPLNEFMPLSALSSTAIYADHETSSMQANQNLHDNGLNPGAIVMPKNRLIWEKEQADEIEADINKRFGGVDKAHRWGVFRHEVEIHTAGITPAESQFIEGMSYDVESVARAYDWPIDLLAGKRTYENVQMAFRRAWQTIVMEAAIIASDITEFLLPMFDIDEPLIPFFDPSNIAVLQETETLKWERERTMIDLVITRNEWRKGQGLVAIEGGDMLYIGANTLPLETAAEITLDNEQPLLGDGEEDGEPALLTEPNGSGT
jgi:HK97 family phage portal protein